MKALKRILRVPMYSSEQLLLHRHIALLQAKYYHRLCSGRCFLIKMNMPFLRCGLFYNYIDTLFWEKYGVCPVMHLIVLLLVFLGCKIMKIEKCLT